MRRQQIIHIALAALALTAYLWGATRLNRLAALPDPHGFVQEDFPVEIEGRRVGSLDELEFFVQGFEVGERLVVETASGYRVLLLGPALSGSYRVISWVNGLFFWLVSILVFAPRIQKVPARDLYWASLLYGLAVMVGDVFFPPRDEPRWWMGLAALRVFAVGLLPVLLFRISLVFPKRRRFIIRFPWIVRAVAGTALIIAAAHCLALFFYFLEPNTTRFERIDLPATIQRIFLVLVFSVGCVSFYVTGRRSEDLREKEQAKWILWGITFGAAPFVFFHSLPLALYGDPFVPIEVARLFSVIIPIAFSFTVIWYQFLDIDVIIRRSLLYPALAAALVGMYLILASLIGRSVEEHYPSTAPYVPIVATLIPVLLFDPTRRGLEMLVDRTFFKIRYDYKQSLREYRLLLETSRSQRDLARVLHDFLQHKLDPKLLAVGVRYKDRYFWSAALRRSLLDEASGDFAARITESAPLCAVGSTGSSRHETKDFPSLYREAGIRIVQPLYLNGTLYGLVLCGEKRSERRYIEQDLELIESAAHETSSSLESTNLTQEVLEESMERSRLDEMNRFKSDFFSKVAHDLRSPLTSISWSARNLLDGIVGPVNDKQAEYLNGIEASTSQLVRLVNNLLEVSRLESADSGIEVEPVMLTEVVEQSIERARPTVVGGNVRLEFDNDGKFTPVCGERQKLAEILDNLLSNAMRFSPPDGTIEIGVESGKGASQVLRVRDHGPGILPEDFERIFEPYQQGRPSPHSSQHGFGLGLHVVRSYVELMGGRVTARNHPQGGALFEVEFREWTKTKQA